MAGVDDCSEHLRCNFIRTIHNHEFYAANGGGVLMTKAVSVTKWLEIDVILTADGAQYGAIRVVQTPILPMRH